MLRRKCRAGQMCEMESVNQKTWGDKSVRLQMCGEKMRGDEYVGGKV